MKKVLFVLFCMYAVVANAQTDREMVMKAIQDAKDFIAQKQYERAREKLVDMRFGVLEDSIAYYLQYIDYQVELDEVETVYRNKHFQKARRLFDSLYANHKNVIKSTPNWILRCDTIIEAQKRGEAIAERFANVINHADNFSFIKEGVWRIWIGDKCIHINNYGDTISYANLGYSIVDNHLIVNKNTGDVVADSKKYNAIIPDWSEVFGDEKKGLYCITSEDEKKRGVMNAKGELVIPMEYEYIHIQDCIIAIKKHLFDPNDYFCFNSEGKTICSDFVRLSSFSENRMWIYRDRKWTKKHRNLKGRGMIQLIDTTGNVIFEKPWLYGYSDYVGNFENGLSYVFSPSPTGDYQYVNKYGETVIPSVFDAVSNFRDGYAKVRFHGEKEWKFINTKGEVVTEEETKRKIYPPGFEEIMGDKKIPGYSSGVHKDCVGLRDKYGTTTLDYKE